MISKVVLVKKLKIYFGRGYILSRNMSYLQIDSTFEPNIFQSKVLTNIQNIATSKSVIQYETTINKPISWR